MDIKDLKEQFKLRLSGVEDGTYCYSIECNKEFFELAEISDVRDGDLHLRVEMEKTEKSRLGHKLWEWQSLVFDGEVSVEYEYKNLKINLKHA